MWERKKKQWNKWNKEEGRRKGNIKRRRQKSNKFGRMKYE